MKHKVNEIKISYKERVPTPECKKINSSRDAAEMLHQSWDMETIGLHETFKVVLLNNANRVKGVYTLSEGGITGVMVDIRILFATILKSLSVAIIVAHNHPSGTLRPSGPDKEVTKKIKKAGELFDIKLLDHLIILPDGDYFSFADNNLL